MRQVSGKVQAYILYRDVEQADKPSLLYTLDIKTSAWKTINLSNEYLGSWEPSFDTELWKSKELLHVFVQRVGQGDGESLEQLDPQTVTILEWNPQSLVTGNVENAIELDEVSAFPNPFTDQITIGAEGHFDYWIYSDAGQLLTTGNGNRNVAIGAELSTGIYLLKLRGTDNKWYWNKLIKLP